jgi:hypothetical protein
MVRVSNAGGYRDSRPATLTVIPPYFRILSATPSGADVILTWQALSGRSYQVQYADALDGTPRTNWTNLGSPVVATSSTASFTNTAPASPRFYQVIAQ